MEETQRRLRYCLTRKRRNKILKSIYDFPRARAKSAFSWLFANLGKPLRHGERDTVQHRLVRLKLNNT